MTDEQDEKSELLALTAEIVSSHVSNNAIASGELPGIIETVYATLSGLGKEGVKPEELTPAVPIKKSVTDNHLICLEDGRKMTTLKRHLAAHHDMTPEEYRARWGLPPSYPMVAPSYARKRQELAKKIGLGKKPTTRRTRKK